MPSLSIIIPTHKRTDILLECLRALERQTVADQLEVFVISDGEDAKTEQQVEQQAWRMPVTYRHITKSQQGVARNRGVEAARAPICLFINDDILLADDACAVHLKAHKAYGKACAVLGFTTWDPSLEITPAMHWLEQSGWQFGYPHLREYAHKEILKTVQHKFTYTSHISLPTVIAKALPFREDVSLYGWEDIEWGSRLKKKGVTLLYEPDARAYHKHHLTLEQSLERMETVGVSAARMAALDASFDRVPKGWKRMAYEIAGKFPTLAGKHRAAFLRGIKKSITG